jgi:hypothetical protein
LALALSSTRHFTQLLKNKRDFSNINIEIKEKKVIPKISISEAAPID